MAEITTDLGNIRKAVEAGKTIVGTKRTIKALRDNLVSAVYYTTNTPEDVVETLSYYASLNEVPCEKLDVSNEDFGTSMRKTFLISVLSVLK